MSSESFSIMNNILNIVNRVKLLKGVSSEGEVASALGLSKTALSNYKKRGTIPYDNLFTFCKIERVSFDWLLTGEGPKRRDEVLEPAKKEESSGKVWDLDEQDCAILGLIKDLRPDIKYLISQLVNKEVMMLGIVKGGENARGSQITEEKRKDKKEPPMKTKSSGFG